MKRKTLIATLLHDALQKRSKESTRSQAARFAVGLMRGSVLGGVFAISSVAIPAITASAGTPCDTYIPSCGGGLCDCGKCEIQAPICGCGKCGKSKLFRHNPLYRTLDTLAGGIEKVLGLDQCKVGCDSCGDDSCDSGNWMMSALPMLPLAQPSRSAPIPVPLVPATRLKSPSTASPRLPTVPPLETEPSKPREFQPQVLKPRISQPRIVSPRPEPARKLENSVPEAAPQKLEPLRNEPLQPEPLSPRPTEPAQQPRESPAPESLAPSPQETTGPAPRMTEPRIVPGESSSTPSELEIFGGDAQATDALNSPPAKTTPDATPAPPKKGSLFDALDDLDDPFSEDAARLSEPYQQIRPTGYRSTGIPRRSYRPVYPLPAKTQRHVQPNHKVIGSGLRPADRVELLRRVSHEQPIEPQAAVGRRVLAPYRASR